MAMESLFMILVVLAVLLTVGVPISYSIGISALIAILRKVSAGTYTIVLDPEAKNATMTAN